MSRLPRTPTLRRRRVSFSTVLNFQSPPASRSPRHPRTPLSGHKRTRSAAALSSSSSAATSSASASASVSAPASARRRVRRRSSLSRIEKPVPRHNASKHHSRHHKHHHDHHHARDHKDPSQNALVVYAGSTPGKPRRPQVLREACENLPRADDVKLPKNIRQCERHCCHHRAQRHLERADKENVPTVIGPKPYNVAAQNKYIAELRQLSVQAEQRAAERASPNFFPAPEAAKGSFFPSLDSAGGGVLAVRTEVGNSPLERIAFLEENGAKVHMHRFVFSHLQLSVEDGWAGMLHALDSSHLHALYVLARRSPCGLALLRRAESEEREVARLHVAVRRGLGKYAVARVVADERRRRRVARLGLRMFLENEGGVWTEESGVESAVRAIGQRIDRLRGFRGVGVPEMEREYAQSGAFSAY